MYERDRPTDPWSPAAPDDGLDSRRPWGGFTVLADGGDYRVKRIEVRSGLRVSLQRHRHRAEHWHIVRGRAVAHIDGTESVLEPGDSIDVPLGAVHRIGSIGRDSLVFIEVQRGDYFGEDDIERLEDDFGRA